MEEREEEKLGKEREKKRERGLEMEETTVESGKGEGRKRGK